MADMVKIKAMRTALDAVMIERDALAVKNKALQEALKSIRQYGSDTLSGPSLASDDTRDWQRASVREMTRRANLALRY